MRRCGRRKLIGCEEAPYVGGVNCEWILEAESRIREAVNPFGDTAVCRTRIEHQVKIFQIQPAFGQVAAGHSDTAKAYDAVVIAKTGGLDIAKRHGRGQVISHMCLLSLHHGGGAHQHAATTETPRRPGGAGGGEEQANQDQASVSACALRSRERARAAAGGWAVRSKADQGAAPARPRTRAAREQAR